ncbi:MAG: PDZ domain-containing protein [Corynebacterium sp.]|uniref:YlbL family protein n=1 Tax=Corynebacterium sp. TaxID=1720 RepID=UPI0026DCC5DD|nr:PDZ domain-containing protein [Corynebacterium sp.]MDO5097561.1 PDZ domain-containing protein [Corynebacterium sp.]
MNRRIRTLVFGAVPVLALLLAVNTATIPGTNISVTVPYAAEGQGPTFNTLGEIDGVKVVDITGTEVDETAGKLNMTTVSVRTNMTVMQAASRWLLSGDNLIPIEQVIPQDKSEDEVNELNQQAFLVSESAATTAALRYLDKPLEVEVASIVADSPAHEVMEVGDRIIAIGGTDVKSGGHAQELVRKKRPGDVVEVSFVRDDKRMEAEVILATHPDDPTMPLLGISMVTVPAEDITVEYNLDDIGGPSAGMIFALAVVDKLSPGKLNGGKFVAGTGTIDDNGTVGYIGGVVHKAKAAADSGAELFLAPRSNCGELRGKNFGTMTVAAVDTLEEAIAQMDNFAAGKDVEGCR